MNGSRGGYEDGYEACNCFWGHEPGSYVQKLASELRDFSGLRALDAGCGEGKNAAFLAGKGADVVAIDVSKLAIGHARSLHAGSKVTWVRADASKFDIGVRYYDVVVAYGLFHCLSSEQEIRELQLKLSDATRPGGFHVICCFNDRDQDLSAHPNFNPCLMSHSYYLALYEAWDIRDVSDEIICETHPHNCIPHHHSLTRILARKRL